jgi:hypothetical protein
MADYAELTYAHVVGLFNTIIGDTTGQFGDPGTTPDIYNVNMPVTLKVWVAGTSTDEVPELRIVDADPPRTILLAPISARVESGVLRLPGADEDQNGVDIVAKSAILGLGDTPLLLTASFGLATINGREYQFDPITVELPTVEPADYHAGRVQTITITGSPAGGQFALVYGVNPTAYLTNAPTALQMQTALRGLAAIGTNVDVTGPVVVAEGQQYTATFTGPMAAMNPLILGSIENLTGGTQPDVVVRDTYVPATIDLTTADRVLLPPSTPPAELVLRRLPATYEVDVDGNVTFVDEQGDPMGPSFDPGGGGGLGDMLKATYDPANVNASPFARANHSGTQPSTTISDFTEAAQDAVAAMLAAGTNVTLSYDDVTNSLSIAAGGGGGLDAEAVRDAIGIAMIGAGVISVTVNDGADTITISSTATANATDAALRDRSTHTGTQSADTVVDGTTNKVLSAANKTKLDGIATGATANATDAALRDRALHTGTQTAATIADFTEAAQDAIAALLAGSGGVTLSYNDAGNTLTIVGTAGGEAETIRDTIGIAMLGAGLITVGVNDGADTITISTTATANSTDAALRDRSTHTGGQTASTITDFSTAADARVTALAVLKSMFTTKGDLAVATGSGAVARLAAGTTGHVLTADPSTSTGLKWAEGSGGGGGGVAPVVQLLGDATLEIAHGMGSRGVRLTVIRNSAPWDTIELVRYERTDLNTITVLPDEPWAAGFALGVVEFMYQTDNEDPDPGTLTFVSADETALHFTYAGQSDNVAVTRIDAHDGDTDALIDSDLTGGTYDREGLTGGIEYSTYLRVYDAEGNFADTTPVVEETDAPAGDTTDPVAGTAAVASKTSTSITYTFTAGSDNVAIVGVDAYDGATDTLLDADVTSPWTRGTGGFGSPLTPDTEYNTFFRHRDLAGNFDDTADVIEETNAAAGPVTPAGSSTGNRLTSGTTIPDSIVAPATSTKLLGVAWITLSHSNHHPTPATGWSTLELLDSADANWEFVDAQTGGQFSGTQLGTVLCFKQRDMVESVTHNLTANLVKAGFTWTSIQIDVEVYDNAEDLGTMVKINGTTGVISVSIPDVDADNYGVMCACSSGAISGGSFTSGANVRYNNGGSVTGTGDYMGVVDKAGPGAPMVLNSGGSQSWGAMGAEVEKVVA